MKFNILGSSDLLVSEVCLGTFTWGMQTSEQEAHQQLDYAISRGVNFIDTAELYPLIVISDPTKLSPKFVPCSSEKIIGKWLQKHPEMRSKLIISTKVLGFMPNSLPAAHRCDPPLPGPPYPDARLNRDNILAACNSSLRRLNTDYIDLYYLHWPDRYAPVFGRREYKKEMEREAVPIRETLLALKELIDSRKIRYYGLSNETTFGVCEFVRIADELGMARPCSIQNEFSLLNRAFEFELAEACGGRNYNIGLLPWSVLGGGVLCGEFGGTYDKGNEDSSNDKFGQSRFGVAEFKALKFQYRFISKAAMEATEKYRAIAKKVGISMATLAHAFCKSRWYITSTITAALTIEQLKENIDSFQVELNEETLKAIDEVHNANKDLTLSV